MYQLFAVDQQTPITINKQNKKKHIIEKLLEACNKHVIAYESY